MSILSQFFGGGGGVPLTQGGTVPPGTTVAEVFLVGGGGSGAPGSQEPINNQFRAQGGTAGEIYYSSAFVFTHGVSYTITIGGAGSNSSIVGGNKVLIANGGPPDGRPGGFGRNIDQYTRTYGYPAYTSGTAPRSNRFLGGGGGGGAGSSGSNAELSEYFGGPSFNDYLNINKGGNGGGGKATTITGIIERFGGGGGGGGGYTVSVLEAWGGLGGNGGPDGNGGNNNTPVGVKPGTPGAANTGNGGGGGAVDDFISFGSGGLGGSGVCIIRYPTAYAAATVNGNAPTPAQSGYNVYRWNSGPGTIIFN